MKYKPLGNSGPRVSEFVPGAMPFGNDWGWGEPKDESQRFDKASRDSGGIFVDTANLHGGKRDPVVA